MSELVLRRLGIPARAMLRKRSRRPRPWQRFWRAVEAFYLVGLFAVCLEIMLGLGALDITFTAPGFVMMFLLAREGYQRGASPLPFLPAGEAWSYRMLALLAATGALAIAVDATAGIGSSAG
jgi:hypothetical protein